MKKGSYSAFTDAELLDAMVDPATKLPRSAVEIAIMLDSAIGTVVTRTKTLQLEGKVKQVFGSGGSRGRYVPSCWRGPKVWPVGADSASLKKARLSDSDKVIVDLANRMYLKAHANGVLPPSDHVIAREAGCYGTRLSHLRRKILGSDQ